MKISTLLPQKEPKKEADLRAFCDEIDCIYLNQDGSVCRLFVCFIANLLLEFHIFLVLTNPSKVLSPKTKKKKISGKYAQAKYF